MNPVQSDKESVRQGVREVYGRLVEEGRSCGCAPSCCSPAGESVGGTSVAESISKSLGYSPEQLAAVPQGANLGLGCGNPQAIAALRPGEVVLDLGSGAGFDAFLAAGAVGVGGRVIGVDMTPGMVEKARRNLAAAGFGNVEFRIGEIENLPVADATVDVILSNCVINLSPDKPRVFQEAFRVLRPGGRLAVSDIVALGPIPDEVRRDWELYSGCVAGAATVDEAEAMLKAAGFRDVRISPKAGSAGIVGGWFPGRSIEDHVASANIEATKPLDDR